VSEHDDTEPAVLLDGVGFTTSAGVGLVHGVDLWVSRGETVALVGRSGSGKTTLLKLINGLLRPTAGRIQVLGRDQEDWDPIRLRRHTGYVIQEVGLFPHFTVERNVALVPRLEGWDAGRIRARVRELLELVGLDPGRFASRYPAELSGGQRQRVGVARALAADPPLLLLDEPFGAVDPLTRSELQVELRAIQGRVHKTMILVTHDVREALLLADRIALVREGTLQRVAPASDFLEGDDPEVTAYRRTVQPL
jgi:osmoprotectant transport system ATP-binding protein